MNIRKFKIKYSNLLVVFLAGLLFGGTSCDDLLEEKPKSSFVKEYFYQDVEQANMGVIGIYSKLMEKWNYTYSNYLALVYPLDNDVTFMSGLKTTGWRQIPHYSVTTTYDKIEKTWKALYQGLDRANVAVEEIEAMDMYTNGTESEKADLKRYLAEALTLRAMISFDLVRLWGDVPYKTTATKSPKEIGDVVKTPRQEIYAQMVADLKKAIPLWPTAKATTNERVNQGSARAYLTRILLYRAGYSLESDGAMKRPDNYKEYIKEAAVVAKAMVEAGQWGLLPSYEQVFRNYTSFIDDPTESLFEVAHWDPGYWDGLVGEIGYFNTNYVSSDHPAGKGSGYVRVNPMIRFEYTPGDVRKDVTMLQHKINGDGEPYSPRHDFEGWYLGKWRRDKFASGFDYKRTHVNWCLIRYADVLLMLAEATNEVRDDLPEGVTLLDGYNALNQVRNRAGVHDLPISVMDDPIAYRDSIRKERKLELVGEGWRKFDLIRWNILGESIRSAGQALSDSAYRDNAAENKAEYIAWKTFDDNKDELFPIPQFEIDANSLLEQNPGF